MVLNSKTLTLFSNKPLTATIRLSNTGCSSYPKKKQMNMFIDDLKTH
jgi:hypothetical protein